MTVLEGGRDSRTYFRVLREVDGRSLLEVKPETGRTHQIRVHLQAMGHPIVADPVYGKRPEAVPSLRRQFLHAQRLAFTHPSTGKSLVFEAPLPDDLLRALAELEHA
jgi:23S rRNA pseudouridine1911/1915/1917 synthase